MARKKQNLIVVYFDSTAGKFCVSTHGEDEDAARVELAMAVRDGLKAKLFDGVELPFEQGIIIGQREEAPKQKRKRKVKDQVPVPSNGSAFIPVPAGKPA